MTDPEIDRLLALEAEATPGPWEWQGEGEPPGDLLVAHGHFQAWGDGFPGFEYDKEFIVAARSALKPALLEVRRLRQEIKRLDEALKAALEGL